MITKTELTFYHLHDKLIEHDLIKNELLDLIENDYDGVMEGRAFIPGLTINNDKTKINRLDFKRHSNQDRPWTKCIENHLFPQLQKMINSLGYSYYNLKALWYQQYEKGDIHDWHIHTEHFTGVYYLELPESAPHTLLYNKNKMLLPRVEEGDIVIFPAMTPHMSPQIKSNERKTIVSFNFNVVDIDIDELSSKNN